MGRAGKTTLDWPLSAPMAGEKILLDFVPQAGCTHTSDAVGDLVRTVRNLMRPTVLQLF